MIRVRSFVRYLRSASHLSTTSSEPVPLFTVRELLEGYRMMIPQKNYPPRLRPFCAGHSKATPGRSSPKGHRIKGFESVKFFRFIPHFSECGSARQRRSSISCPSGMTSSSSKQSSDEGHNWNDMDHWFRIPHELNLTFAISGAGRDGQRPDFFGTVMEPQTAGKKT